MWCGRYGGGDCLSEIKDRNRPGNDLISITLANTPPIVVSSQANSPETKQSNATSNNEKSVMDYKLECYTVDGWCNGFLAVELS